MLVMQPFDYYHENIAEGAYNMATDQWILALTSGIPDLTYDRFLANLTEISYTNCSSRILTVSDSSQTGGIYGLKFDDLTLTASGGSVGPFWFGVIYNDTTPGKYLSLRLPLFSSPWTLADGNKIVFHFNAPSASFIMAET